MSDLHDDLSALSLPSEPQAKKRRPTVVIIVGLVVLIAAGTLALVFYQISRRPIPVRLAEASLKSRWAPDVVLIATGHVEPNERAVAAALAPGRVKSVLVTQGAHVGKGAVIAELDGQLMDAQMKEAKVALSAARAKIGAARKKLAIEKKKRDEAAIDAAASALNAGAAAVKAAEARIATLRLALQNTRVKAPAAGTVWKIHATVGQSLSENALKVADIVDLSTLFLDADVSESKLGVTRVDMPADVMLDAFPNRHFDATVVELRPEVNKETATGVVRLRFANAEPDVLLNMAGRVSFLRRAVPMPERSAPPRVSVPKAALTERAGKPCVFVYSESGAAMLPVEVGDTIGSDVEITKGLKPGERVITSPPAGLEDGRAVELMP